MEEVVGDHGRRELLQDVRREGFELLRAELRVLMPLSNASCLAVNAQNCEGSTAARSTEDSAWMSDSSQLDRCAVDKLDIFARDTSAAALRAGLWQKHAIKIVPTIPGSTQSR
eukprot:CAMPEP_0198681100 /NCGR_PEP_ID=MMETSP1468-20131203/6181_1 /TAXON_ID=1461545 /ORGANISM="Mantoniella sp, Strain CCMP1436" /LENGTH=112 /DNA_ID=CAMNT_0044422369 /DNA_START=38 /DNA_END=374 /DNA_ORIENTATION=-